MAYFEKLHDGEHYHPWFIKAYNSAIPRFNPEEKYSMARVFSEFFDLKVVMDTNTDEESPIPVYLVFPNKEDAIMFIMRWS